jgi:hypothetical protein
MKMGTIIPPNQNIIKNKFINKTLIFVTNMLKKKISLKHS